MDGRQFDAITRAVAGDVPRRRALTLLAAAAGGGLAGLLPGLGSRGGAALAASTGTPATAGAVGAAAVSCPGNNFPDGAMACDSFWNEYIRTWGVFCPDGTWLPRAGCTAWQFAAEPAQPSLGPIQWTPGRVFGICASRTTNWTIQITDLRSDIIHYRPTYATRDPGACNAEFNQFINGLWAHENEHQTNFVNAVDQANALWTNRVFSACGSDDPVGRKQTLLFLKQNIDDAAERTRATIRSEAGREGAEPTLDCRKCWHACPSWAPVPCSDSESCCGPGSICVPGGCRRISAAHSEPATAGSGSGVSPRYYPTSRG